MSIYRLTLPGYGTPEYERLKRVGYLAYVHAEEFIISALDESDARNIASTNPFEAAGPYTWWLDETLTNCELLDDNTPTGVISSYTPS